ncbi:peptidyl-tRNA hydrolase 2, mitochondrial-like [Chrysoperla carnea]|uniref:peptidyl-tRNA hydrolase 2, mitochondrial-like n=1 Tax=Chrysoperla carnea TaxID=189513 RepID=UPI001D08F769|nr:peptidyl-tRNA hydrolase 2, mitochondrial-like [Chrysoperla carnea]
MESPNSGSWQPNEELLEMLTGMGISKIAAEHALYYTGNQSAEAAACYVFDNPDIDVMPPLLTTQKKTTRSKKTKSERIGDAAGSSDDEEEDYHKMVFVINSSLNMGPGKLASQVAHAALGLYRTLRSNTSLAIQGDAITESLYEWENDGEKKIVLRGVDESHLRELEAAAQSIEGLHVQTIIDAGHTQVAPGSLTVLAIFGKEQIIDKVTGELPLL